MLYLQFAATPTQGKFSVLADDEIIATVQRKTKSTPGSVQSERPLTDEESASIEAFLGLRSGLRTRAKSVLICANSSLFLLFFTLVGC